jgi:glutathione S-transferase
MQATDNDYSLFAYPQGAAPFYDWTVLELFNSPVSTCSQKVRLALAEKELPWTDRRVSFARQEHIADWYLRLNPNGVVPTLVDDGRPVVDSSVINEYLEDRFPERPLRPADPYELARMRAWRQFIDEIPTPAVRVPSFNAFVRGIWAHLSQAEFEELVGRLPLRKHFYRRMRRDGFPNGEVQAALDQLQLTLDRMEQALQAGPWLLGEAYTLADVSLVPVLVRMEDLGLADMWEERPRVADWYARVQARPAFAAAYYPGSRELGPAC